MDHERDKKKKLTKHYRFTIIVVESKNFDYDDSGCFYFY